MDIGTAKPTKEFCKEIPHHLIDILEPDQQFNVSDFIDALLDRGRSWHTGYRTEDFVNALDFKDIEKESQIKNHGKITERYE